MPKILSAQQIKDLDAYTIQHEPIASIDLMERACRAFESWFIGRFDFTYRVGIVCGTGNNGGDGLGIARLLRESGYAVQVWIVKGNAIESIDCMNQTDALRIAIDVPSGLMIDKPSSGLIVKAHHTVSFQLPKLAFLLPQSYPFVGNWNVVPIGLNKDFIKEAASDYHYLSIKDVKRIVKPRLIFDHKGRYGHALIIAGSF